MKSIFAILLSFIAVFVMEQNAIAQNLDQIGKIEKPLTITGGISVNQMFYYGEGSQSGREPYTYYLAGNINFNLYGWLVPFSYTYSNQQSSIQQPFNQYSIHPSYKWITAHIGYTSMTFSPYTLNGHQFLGAGFELSPTEKFKIAAMYGRLQKAIEYDSANTSVEPAYRRFGYGIKGSAKLGSSNIDIIYFQSADKANSINSIADSLELYPEQNIALGINSSTLIFNKLNFYIEYGSSLITKDLRSDVISENLFLTKRTSTERLDALKLGVKYSLSNYKFGITYERIDPGYRTHGAYYFNNDLENVTANFTASIIQSKLTFGSRIGIQRDDIENQKVSNMTRVVHSHNIGFVPVSQLNLSATYSNFKSHTNIKSQFESINQLTAYDNLDTLDFTQISENMSLNMNYTLSSNETSRQNLNFNSSFQKASEYQDQVESNSGASFISMNLAHNYSLVKTNTAFTGAINYCRSHTESLTTNTFGPTISVRKSFLDNKMRTSISTSYNNTYSNGNITNKVLTIRLNGGYVLKKKHNFNLSAANVNRSSVTDGGTNKFIEYTVTFGYTYNF